MIVWILLLCAGLAIGAASAHWRKTSAVLSITTVVILFAISCGPVPKWLLEPLQRDYVIRPVPAWGSRNLIVILGYGTVRPAPGLPVEPLSFAYPRIMTGAQLYQQCRTLRPHADCKLLVSGGDALRTGETEAAVYRNSLIALGVPERDILVDADSMNTWQNAQFTARQLKHYPGSRVFLVTSSFHLRRSLLYFAHFDIYPTPWRADLWQARNTSSPRGENFALTDVGLHEWIGIARYHFYNWMHWNVARTGAGQA